MNIIDFENSNKLTSITYKGVSVWMLIRSQVELAEISKINDFSMKLRKVNLILLVKACLYGIVNIFKLKKFDYWFFSYNDKRFPIGDKLKDIYFDDIADTLGQNKSLFIEYSMNKYSNRKNSYSNNSMGDLVFQLIAILFSLLVNLKSVKEIVLIEDLVKSHKLPLNVKRTIKSAIGEYLLFNSLFKLFKPKKLFLICYYSKVPMIAAARNNKIIVIEYQHGVISKNCPFYNSPYRYMKKYFPSLLYTFGTDLKVETPPLFIYNMQDILPMGSFYLHYILHNFSSTELRDFKLTYEKIVCVTFSGAHFDDLMCFVRKLSLKHPNFLFILKHKHLKDTTEYLTSNIVSMPQYHIYQILKYSDYNIQIASFVAYEAEYYGVYNILLNIKGIARRYIISDVYGEFVEPEQANAYSLPETSNMEYIKKNKFFVDYTNNIKNFCNE
jgi:hypothetical protein